MSIRKRQADLELSDAPGGWTRCGFDKAFEALDKIKAMGMVVTDWSVDVKRGTYTYNYARADRLTRFVDRPKIQVQPDSLVAKAKAVDKSKDRPVRAHRERQGDLFNLLQDAPKGGV